MTCATVHSSASKQGVEVGTFTPTINAIEEVAASIGEVSISGDGSCGWEISINAETDTYTATGDTIREALRNAVEEIAVDWDTEPSFGSIVTGR